jgi:hypothetical protein
MSADRIEAAREALAEAEQSSGQERREALAELASQLEDDAQGASDQAKVRTLAAAVGDLADAES